MKHQGVNFHPLKINLKASSKINKKNKRKVGCGEKMSREKDERTRKEECVKKKGKHNFYVLSSRLNLQTL